jgi:hypothetical protein
MDDDNSPPWTMAQHLAAGLTAIAQIEADCMRQAPERVCHHFYEVNPVDMIRVSVEATYRHLVPLFASVGVDFLPDRLEAWETVKPQRDWLQKRVPAILGAGETAGLIYQGWTWEPRDRQPIGACDFLVINNRTV